MAVKIADLTLEGDGLHFVAHSGSGHKLVLDDAHGDEGMRPAELIPLAIAGCSAMDVITILRKKRQTVSDYQILASGIQQDDHPNAFVRIDVVHVIVGPSIDVEAVRRAIELSATKYCSVGATLSSGLTEIHHRYVVRDEAGREETDEVIVIGPYEPTTSPGDPAARPVAVTV